MNGAKQRATRTASGDWNYRGFVIRQCYRTRRWGAVRGTEVFWANTLRSSKFRIDCFFDACPNAHTCRHGIDN